VNSIGNKAKKDNRKMPQTNVTIQTSHPITVQTEPLVLSNPPALQKPYTSLISGNGRHYSSGSSHGCHVKQRSDQLEKISTAAGQ